MEHLIYSIVKGASAAYILYNVYCFLLGKHAADFWRLMLPIQEKRNPAAPQAKPEPVAYSIVGKSQTVYLEESPKVEAKTIEPAFSEDLPQAPAYEEEPDITDSDVEYSLEKEAERFLPLDTEPDTGDYSTGLTFEQIFQALDVVQGRQTDEAGKAAAARILYEIEGSDVFDFLAAQAENEAMIERLLKENLDNNSIQSPENTRKQKRKTEEFDMDKYV